MELVEGSELPHLWSKHCFITGITLSPWLIGGPRYWIIVKILVVSPNHKPDVSANSLYFLRCIIGGKSLFYANDVLPRRIMLKNFSALNKSL